MEKDISYEEFEEFIERYFLQSVKEMKAYNDEQNEVESTAQYKSTIDEGMMDNISQIVDGIDDQKIQEIIGWVMDHLKQLVMRMEAEMRADLQKSGDYEEYGEEGIRIAVYEDLKDSLNHLFSDILYKWFAGSDETVYNYDMDKTKQNETQTISFQISFTYGPSEQAEFGSIEAFTEEMIDQNSSDFNDPDMWETE